MNIATSPSTLMQASHQWASRPDDQRFTSLTELQAHTAHIRNHSTGAKESTRDIMFTPVENDPTFKGLQVNVANRHLSHMNHWSFGQAATLAKAPAGFLRTLPAPIVCDALNYAIRFNRDAEEVGLLRFDDNQSDAVLTAATGPNYGRIWNSDIVAALSNKFGDGVTGDWKVPGEFGRDVPVTKANTTLFASDRDMFVFLCDEKNRIEMKDRRDGQAGSLARGFFIWNSEVGDKSMGAAFFMFDYVCQNRIVWGVKDFKEMRLKHTSGAPGRWLREIEPVLVQYANAAAAPVQATIAAAQAKSIKDDMAEFMAKRFTSKLISSIEQAHMREEGRPMETIWDVVTGTTAHAKTIPNQDERVKIEREAGKILDLVAV